MVGIIEEELAASPELMKEFQRGRLELELTELICDLMEEQEVTRAELARRLGTSRAYVTKVLRDGSNMTVRTIADIFSCLGRSLRLVARPLSIRSPQLLVGEVPQSTFRAVRTQEVLLEPSAAGLEFRSSLVRPQFTAPKTTRPEAA